MPNPCPGMSAALDGEGEYPHASGFTNKRPPHVDSSPSGRLPLNAGSSQIAASDGSVLTSAFAFWLLSRLTSATATTRSCRSRTPGGRFVAEALADWVPAA